MSDEALPAQGDECASDTIASLQKEFLSHVAEGRSVRFAATAIGVTADVPHQWRGADTSFAAAWLAADAAGTDVIEEEAFRRAVSGVEKPVYRGGEVVGHVADYSDAMLMFLLKARRPERYGNIGSGAHKQSPEPIDLRGTRDALIGKFLTVIESGGQAEVPDQPD